MTPISVVLYLITLLTAINSGTILATKCWECNSRINPLCYRFDRTKFASINCNKPPTQYHKQLLENGIEINPDGYLVNPDISFCRKILQYVLSIKCWRCNSFYQPYCRDPFSGNDDWLIDCDDDYRKKREQKYFRELFIDHRVEKSTFCRKILNEGHAIRCFECNSAINPSCKDPFDRTAFSLRECNGPLAYTSANVCRKIVNRVNNEFQVIRSCGAASELDKTRHSNNECVRRDSSYQILHEYCICARDACNGSQRIGLITSFIPMMFMLLIIRKFLF